MTCKWPLSIWILVDKGSVRFQIMESNANVLSTLKWTSICLFLEYDTKEIFSCEIYDKYNAYCFPIVNFPF